MEVTEYLKKFRKYRDVILVGMHTEIDFEDFKTIVYQISKHSEYYYAMEGEIRQLKKYNAIDQSITLENIIFEQKRKERLEKIKKVC